MDRHWRDVHVCVIRCQFRYYFGEIQLFKDAHARLRWPAYSCAICDLCLHINPKLMMPQFLKHLQDIVCIFFFPVWPWEQFSAGTSNSACVAQIPTYMHSLFFFFQKASRSAVEAQPPHHVFCLLFVYSVVLLYRKTEKLV